MLVTLGFFAAGALFIAATAVPGPWDPYTAVAGVAFVGGGLSAAVYTAENGSNADEAGAFDAGVGDTASRGAEGLGNLWGLL